MTTLTRSTNAISDFVRASRKAAAAALALKQAESEMAALTPDVLNQIGDSRTVKVDGAIATLTPRVTESIKRTCDDEIAVQFFRSHGMNVNVRSAEYVAPAAFSAAVRKGAVSPDLYEITTTTGVNVI